MLRVTLVFKTIILLQRKGNMSEEDFHKYWRNVHGPFATRLPGLRRYVQNVVTYYSDTTPGYNTVLRCGLMMPREESV